MKREERYDFQTSIRLSASMYEELCSVTKAKGMTAMEYIRRAVQAALDKERPAAPHSWTDDDLRAKIAAMEDDLEAMKLYLRATGKIAENTGESDPQKITAKRGENA